MTSIRSFTKHLKVSSNPLHLHSVHAALLKRGLDKLPFPISKLLSAAAATVASVNGLAYARTIYDSIPYPNLFQRNAILRAYALTPCLSHAAVREAMFLFNSSIQEGFLDQFSFISTLLVCSRTAALRLGRQTHTLVLQAGFNLCTSVRNVLIQFYCRCGELDDAHNMLAESPERNDAVSWATLLSGYFRLSEMETVVRLFRKMHSCRVEINTASLVSVLSASSECVSLRDGKALHCYCCKTGFSADLNVMSAIMKAYMKFGCLICARELFNSASGRDLVLCNCMIDGYAREGLVTEAMELINDMRRDRLFPSTATYARVLTTCASSGDLQTGRRVQRLIEEDLLELDVILGTALVDMYSKSGDLGEAVEVFNRMRERDVKAWTTMIMGYGLNGHVEAAVRLFSNMMKVGVMPNEVTFLAVLSACSHGGFIAEAKENLETMVLQHGLTLKAEHFGCLINLFARAGRLEEAYVLVRRLSCKGDAMAWRALLSACRLHGNADMAERVCIHLASLGETHPTDAILLSSTYASRGRWDDIIQVMRCKDDANWISAATSRSVGCSRIEV